MATFVNDTSNAFMEHWGGYLPCANAGDCTLPGEVRFEKLMICTPSSTGPIRTQSYCQCDYSLTGRDCSAITEGSIFRAVMFLIFAVFPVTVVIPYGMQEIFERSRPLKWNSVYTSLLLAMLACVFNILWGVLGAYFVWAAPTAPGFVLTRTIFSNVAIPGSLACSFSAAMVISLAWRKVVIASDLRSKNNREEVEKREKRIKHVVVILCFLLFFSIALSLLLISLKVATILLSIFNIFGAVFYFRSGRNFERNLSSTFGKSNNTEKLKKMTPEQLCLFAASKANRMVTNGLALVCISSILLITFQTFIGMPGFVGEYELATLPTAGISVGNTLSQMAVVMYSRRVRMVGVNRRKAHTSKTKAGLAGTETLSAVTETESVRPFSSTPNGNKVSPA